MSGWLNLNESLNTLKGQISNFANNVLAENEEGAESTPTNYEELKILCVQKDCEIENLKKVNEELQRCIRISDSQNGEPNDNNWDWTTPELLVDEKVPKEKFSDLKTLITELENEKKDLINQLEQLDTENQQNLAELVRMREHLQDENNNLKEKCSQLKQQNKAIASREEELKKDFKELQTKIKKSHDISPSAENTNEKCEGILKNNQELKMKLEDTMKELSVLKSTHDTLEKILRDSKKNGENELAQLMEKLKKSEMENKIIYSELQKAKENVALSEQKIQEDAENCQKLAFILESYDKQVSSLKKELDNIQNERNNDKNIEFLENRNQELQARLDEALKKVDILTSENSKSKNSYEETMQKAIQESMELRQELEEKTKELNDLKKEREISDTDEKLLTSEQEEEIQNLNKIVKEMSLEKENMHKTYVNIITDNVKRYIDSALVPSVQCELPEDPHVLEFSKQVEDIFKILLDYKQKCEIFEKEVLEVSKEKTKLLNEKNSEIEKLIQNSEVLSQDVIHKAETIKELETEVTNLMTSNDVLLSELDSYKNSGLQTISESNEDNMVLLETDLDNANKRIKELEQIIDGGGKIISNESSSTSLEAKISGKLEDYQELLNSFDDLKIDYDALKKELTEKCTLLNSTETENDDLKLQLDRVRVDFENTDYQLSEANFTVDSLKEELESVKLKLEVLFKENKELKLQNMSSIDIKSELNEVKEKWLTEENLRRELEAQVRGLLEKLQNSKMTETSLKLQYDTLSKECAASTETKNNLEQALTNAKGSIAEYENNYTELLQKYDGILLRCEELNTNLHKTESEFLKLQNDFKMVEEQKQKLEKLVEEKNVQLEKAVANEELTSISKAQVEEQEHEIIRLTKMFEEMDIEKFELKKLTEKQASEIQELTIHDASREEALVKLQNQLRLTEGEVANLGSALKESQQNNDDLHSLLNKNTKDSTQQTQENNFETDRPEVDFSFPTQTKESEILLQTTTTTTNQKQQEEIDNLQTALRQNQENVISLQQQLQELTNSRNELINMVTIKHQESLNYHNEIQRLSAILTNENEKYSKLETQLVHASNASEEIAKKNEENDKLTDENNFLKEKCDLLAKNLLEEQAKLQQILTEKSGPSEKELSLSKQLERLQSHLMEIEEHYTQELLQAEQKNAELQAKVTGLEQREKNSSNMYTSVSIRANQQVETLQKQLQIVTKEREDLRKKISDAEDTNSKQAAALANLQFVLQQFQKDKEKDVLKETERIRRQINVEKQVQENLKKEIDVLKEQLEESKIGLQAASRLSDQLEFVKKQNSGLKEEVSQLQQKLARSQETIHNLTSQTDGKIDKTLIKNLIVGLLSSGNSHNWNKDQTQIIKIIATVLDFNQQDHDKIKLNQPQQGSWLGSILAPQPSTQNMSQESLSQAFVKFLENESKPREVPSLLSDQSSRPNTSTDSSKRTTPRASPIVLNEIVLPTFADFGQSRNSSSILKDVLKDNNS